MSLDNGWNRQFVRLKIAFEYLESQLKSNNKLEPHKDEFALVTFFLMAYHMKEWVQKADDSPKTESEIEQFWSSHEELRMTKLVANKTKHLMLTKVKEKFLSTKMDIAVASGNTSQMNSQFSIVHLGESHDAYVVAKKVFHLWQKFLAEPKT